MIIVERVTCDEVKTNHLVTFFTESFNDFFKFGKKELSGFNKKSLFFIFVELSPNEAKVEQALGFLEGKVAAQCFYPLLMFSAD